MSKRYFVEGYSGLTWASCSVSLQPIALSYGTAESGLSFTLQLYVGSAPTEVGLLGDKSPRFLELVSQPLTKGAALSIL